MTTVALTSIGLIVNPSLAASRSTNSSAIGSPIVGAGSLFSLPLRLLHELRNRQTDIFRDLVQQRWCDITSAMERDRRLAAVLVSVLAMRPSLSYESEAEALEARGDLGRLENQHHGTPSADAHALSPDKLPGQLRLTVLEQHRDHLTQVRVQLVERRALRVRPGEAGHVAHVQSSVGIRFDDRDVFAPAARSRRTTPRLLLLHSLCTCMRQSIWPAPYHAST